MCTGCQSLGHTIGAYPHVTRSWVQKIKPMTENASENASPFVEPRETQEQVPKEGADVTQPDNLSGENLQTNTEQPQAVSNSQDKALVNSNDEGWKIVKTKKSKNSNSNNPITTTPGVSLPTFHPLTRATMKNQTQSLKISTKPA